MSEKRKARTHSAVPHPAILIEREAGKQVREWLAKYGARRRS